MLSGMTKYEMDRSRGTLKLIGNEINFGVTHEGGGISSEEKRIKT